MAYAPTLTAYTDASPCPRVLVSFTTLATGAQTINVYRVAEGRQMTVRGGVNLFAVGGVAVMDYEAPFGVAMTYRAEMFDTSGNSLGFTDAAAMTLTVTSSWAHQPLSPAGAVSIKVLLSGANSINKPSNGSVAYPEGATVGVAVGARRTGLSQTALNVRVGSIGDADKFQSLWGDYLTDFPSVICVRTPPPLRIPRVLFASCFAPTEVIGGVNALLTFELVVDEVAPPFPGLLLPLLRREDIDAAFATRGARAAAYATRLARDTDYTKAGLAG